MNVSDDNEITAGGTAVHRQAMVLRQSNRYIGGAGHGNNGVSCVCVCVYMCELITLHTTAYLCVSPYTFMCFIFTNTNKEWQQSARW